MRFLSDARFDEQIAVAYHHLPESLQAAFVSEFGYGILHSAQQIIMDCLEDPEVLDWAADWIEANSGMRWVDGCLWGPSATPQTLEQVEFDCPFVLEEDGTVTEIMDAPYYEVAWEVDKVIVFGDWYVYRELHSSETMPKLESPGTYVITAVTDIDDPTADCGWVILKAED